MGKKRILIFFYYYYIDSIIIKEMVTINRSTILKHLKHHGKYERKHFTMKKLELETQCKELGIDLSQPIINEPVPSKGTAPVTKPKVVLQEPDSDSSDEDDEGSVDPVPTPVPTPSPPEKKLKRKNQRVEKVEPVEKVNPDNKDRVNQILKDLNSVVKELFSEFDKKSIDDIDEEYIRTEFNLIISECQDMLDKLIVDFSDAEIQKIETKIDLQYRKLDRFLG